MNNVIVILLKRSNGVSVAAITNVQQTMVSNDGVCIVVIPPLGEYHYPIIHSL